MKLYARLEDGSLKAHTGAVNLQQVTEVGTSFKAGNALELTSDGVLNVVTADKVEKDNTLPVTSAAVDTTVGNIEILLGTI